MSIRRIVAGAAVLALISALTSASPARATHELVRGFVTDGTTGQGLSGVCVSISPPGCTQLTDQAGVYQIHFTHGTQTAELHFSKAGYQTMSSGTFTVGGHLELSQVLMPVGERELCPSPRSDTPTQSVYLPNVMKLWWEAWQSPFIVQNTGTTDTTLEITFYRFLNGSCAVRRTVTGLRPGGALADVPNNDTDLARFTQYSVVIRSFGSTVVSVVNEQAPFGPRNESLSYVGTSTGATSIFLPNVTRRFFNWVTPIVIQNLGSTEADVTVSFTSFDGTAPDATATRRIPAGASKFVDPNYEPGLMDGKQYTARVTSAQPVSVVVNAHSGIPRNTVPVGYAMNGVTAGADTVYAPYAAKSGGSQRWVSTIVVHNLSQSTITPSLRFDPLGGGGSPHTLTAPAPVGPGRAWAFDPRFTLGTTTPCATQSASCLGDGEYSVIARSNDVNAQIAVAVNLHADGAAMGYAAIPTPAAKIHLPNVTRRLGGANGWTTPILLQAVGTAVTGATLRWHRFSDGALVHTQTVAIRSDTAARIDPRDVPELQDDTQYSVVVDGVGGTLAAIVMQLAAPGDDAMIYEGFTAP